MGLVVKNRQAERVSGGRHPAGKVRSQRVVRPPTLPDWMAAADKGSRRSGVFVRLALCAEEGWESWTEGKEARVTEWEPPCGSDRAYLRKCPDSDG